VDEYRSAVCGILRSSSVINRRDDWGVDPVGGARAAATTASRAGAIQALVPR